MNCLLIWSLKWCPYIWNLMRKKLNSNLKNKTNTIQRERIKMLAEQLSMPMKKVAIYGRVSTVEQANEGYSIDEQLRILREKCQSSGWEVYNEYADRGISGKSIEARPALKQLLDDATKRKFDVVYVWKMNRLARNVKDVLNIVDLLSKRRIEFQSYSEDIDSSTPSGKLHLQMMAVIAEFERDTIAQNVKMGMIARAGQGEWNGGIVLGYDSEVISVQGKRKQTRLVINEKEASTVRRIFELYVNGHGYKSIANLVNQEGHRSKKNNTFSIHAIKTILTNPVYIGMIRYNVRQDWTKKRRNNINEQPVLEKGNHAPIISDEVWNKVKHLLTIRSCKPNRIHSGEHPLTGILKCPECGAGMVLGRNSYKLKSGERGYREYYVCGAWKNKGKAVCHSNGLLITRIDEYVLKKMSLLAKSDQLIENVVKRLNQKHHIDNKPIQVEHERLAGELRDIAERKEKLLGLFELGGIDLASIRKRMANLTEEEEQLKVRMQSVEAKLTHVGTEHVTEELVKAIMVKFQQAFKRAMTKEQRKQLLHLLIDEITIDTNKNVESIRIKLSTDVAKHLLTQEEGESSYLDDFSSSFCVYIVI